MKEKQIGCPNMHDPEDWTRGGECVCAELAAAEERGRRRGVEERDELRAIVRELRTLVYETFLAADAMTERSWERFLARMDRALAPRDSGKDFDKENGNEKDQ